MSNRELLCLALKVLRVGRKRIFVYVDILGLAHSEGNCPRERVDGNRELVVELDPTPPQHKGCPSAERSRAVASARPLAPVMTTTFPLR
jgi:hypothetical protein